MSEVGGARCRRETRGFVVDCGHGLRNRSVGGFELGTDVGISEAGGAWCRRETRGSVVVCGGGLRKRSVGRFELDAVVDMSEVGGARCRREARSILARGPQNTSSTFRRVRRTPARCRSPVLWYRSAPRCELKSVIGGSRMALTAVIGNCSHLYSHLSKQLIVSK